MIINYRKILVLLALLFLITICFSEEIEEEQTEEEEETHPCPCILSSIDFLDKLHAFLQRVIDAMVALKGK